MLKPCCKCQAVAYTLFRVVFGMLFLSHGGQKLLGWFGGTGMELSGMMTAAGYLELIGGALLIVGLFTQITAFILCGMMAVAYFMFHAGQGWWPLLNGGELAVLYCFAFLYMSSKGGGKWSLDAKWCPSSKEEKK